ncbi:hypothetical protein BJ741DRAFT_588754 [Chytriomyces cf. hyalinus JEL632]|nr:hypothetical protein BJ741DRAFT_588754 [Chytriomyces cf. hyalinus JEL632]
MGRLAIFNRRIALAPDDVYIPASYGLILHSVWLASTAVVFAVIRSDCNVHSVLTNFIWVQLVTLCIEVPLDMTMITLSMSGTVARKGLRRYVGGFVQFSFCVLLFELALNCYGIFVTFGPANYLAPNDDASCTKPFDSSSATLMRMVVLWSFLAIVFYFLGLAIFLYGSDSKSGTKMDSYMKIWQQRLNMFVGTGGLVDSDVLRDVAGELATYFKDFDWAPSDVAVGLLLLKREQKKITEIRQARRLIIEQPDGFMIPELQSQKIREELEVVQKEEDATSKRIAWINGTKVIKNATSVSVGKMKLFGIPKMSLSGPTKDDGKSVNLIASPDLIPLSLVPDEAIMKPSLLDADDEPVKTALLRESNSQGALAETVVIPINDLADSNPYKLELDPEVITPSKSAGLGVSFAEAVDVAVGKREAAYAIRINDTEAENSDDEEAGQKNGKSRKLKGKFSLAKLRSPSIPGLSFKQSTSAMTRSMSLTRSRIKTGNTPQFQPFVFRRKKGTGHRQGQIQHGTVLREEIDDILHFARFAEVVYTPEEINMIYSDKLHFHSNDNGIFRSPFLIVHDEDTDSIVIAVRGTYSASDVLVDLKFDVVPLEIPELLDEDHLAHSGFFHTAMNIVTDINRLNILGPLLNDPASEFYGCSLVVTGHSLGAGVAALLANILRKDFPSTCCYAYEPPGCVVSFSAAEVFESFCTSVVMGDDVVTRLSRNTLEMLKLDLNRHLTCCDEPKWRVTGSVLGARICCHRGGKGKRGRDGDKKDRPGLLHRRTSTGGLVPADLETLKRKTHSLRVGKDDPFYEIPLPTIPMYLPGKILHIEKLRRPPLNFNQLLNRQLAKVTGATKAVGKNLKAGAEGIVDLVFEGAEIMKEGVNEITEFAEDVKDIILDGADAVKDKIVGEKLHRPSASNPAVSNQSDMPEGVGGVVPLKDGESVTPNKSGFKKRASLGDILMMRTKSTGDPRLKAELSPVDPDAIELQQVNNAVEGGGIPMQKSTAQKVAFGNALSTEVPNGLLRLGEDGDERKGRSRRRKRKLQRAKSAGQIPRSKSNGREGYETGEEMSAASSDEEIPAQSPGARRKSRRSKGGQDGGVTDTEVFSDTELTELGGRRIRKGDKRGPKIDTTVGGSRAKSPNNAESPTRNRLNPDLIASIKPRAHKDAVPSESIVNPILVDELPSPVKVAGQMVAVQDNQLYTSVPHSPENWPLMPPPVVNITVQEVEPLPVVPEEVRVEIQPVERERPTSLVSQVDVVLSKPQYPPTPSAANKAREGPNIHGKYHYVPRWGRKEEFQEIIVSRSMIADHSPFELLRELQAAPAGYVLGVVTRD